MGAVRAIVGDTETTGPDRVKDRVCEIAWVEIDENLNELDRVYSRIDPQIAISATASGIHGITNADVAEAPTIEEFFDVVIPGKFAKDDEVILIAHNAPFDRSFLQPHVPIVAELCTLRLARRTFPKAENHKLQTLMYQLNLSRGKSHSADGDVDTCLDLLRRIIAETGKSLQALADEALEPIEVIKMPFGKWKDKPLKGLDSGYIDWLLKLDNLDSDLRWTCEQIKKERFANIRAGRAPY